MFGLLEFLIGLAWKILATCFAFGVFFALIRNGRGTIKALITCVGQLLEEGVYKLQQWLFAKRMERVYAEKEQEEQ